ncbi:MAG: ribonuclease H-like domain-containing protein [Candidatus Shapirobacteria bacterium]|jgi:DEAD/DEAH box helicase domain-containing protein
MKTEVIFDIETKKLFEDISSFNPADLGVSIVSLYFRQVDENLIEKEGQIYSFWENEFSNMWDYFSKADRIIGFNSLGFDIPALVPISPLNFKKLPHFDLMDKIKQNLGFRLGLDAVAKECLGHGKTDIGTNAVVYWNENTAESLAKLKKYCEMDVFVTKDIYDYGLKNKHLKYKDKWNTSRVFPIDFSYPQSEKNQISLF